MKPVPFSTIAYEYELIADELQEKLTGLAEAGAFVLSDELNTMERELAEYCAAYQPKEAVGVGSGTDALLLALMAAGIGKGDEVITVGNICVAVMEAIVRAGAVPVFVDICPRTFQIDCEQLKTAISPATRAVLVVHPYGVPAQLDVIGQITSAHGVLLIEACGQAFGARYEGIPVGSFGTISCFSFNPEKIIGGIGDGGAVVTSNPEIADRLRRLRDHGREGIGLEASMVGFSSRLDAINAIAVRLKLRHIDRIVEMRHEKGRLFREILSDTSLTLQEVPDNRTPSFQMFVALAPGNRFELHEKLQEQGIHTAFHYRMPPYKMSAFAACEMRMHGQLVVTEEVLSRIISLPFFTTMTEFDMERVRAAVKAAAKV